MSPSLQLLRSAGSAKGRQIMGQTPPLYSSGDMWDHAILSADNESKNEEDLTHFSSHHLQDFSPSVDGRHYGLD